MKSVTLNTCVPNHPEMYSQLESHECFRIKTRPITIFTRYILHENLSSQHIEKYKRNITGSPLKEIIIYTHNQEDWCAVLSRLVMSNSLQPYRL